MCVKKSVEVAIEPTSTLFVLCTRSRRQAVEAGTEGEPL